MRKFSNKFLDQGFLTFSDLGPHPPLTTRRLPGCKTGQLTEVRENLLKIILTDYCRQVHMILNNSLH
jgi:hypothetical protein